MERYITALSYHVPSETVHIFFAIAIYVFLYIAAYKTCHDKQEEEYLKKLDEIAHAVDGKISYGVLTNGYVPIG